MINYFFRTYGCQANVADSEGLAQYLDAMGCVQASAEESADLVIVNTCAVREKAEQKLWSYLGELKDIKKAKPYLKVGVIGCVASYKKQEIYKRFDHVGFVYGAREEMPALQAYLTDLIVNLETTKQLFSDNPDASIVGWQDRDVKKVVAEKKLSPLSRFNRLAQVQKALEGLTDQPKVAAKSFINIMTGCNKYCAYCIVPFTRGREVSYPMNELVDRVRHDVANGSKEVTLVGQNVNSYVDPETGMQFPELLRRVAAIEGDFWVRYVSPHPQDMTVELFDVMAAHRPKITAYVHFPLQSGSNSILKKMNRNYTIEEYLDKVAWVRERMPDATISTDLIVGFPGETEEDYQATLHALEKVRYDLIYSFIYSPRKYTKAWPMQDDCPAAVKSARLELLQKRQIDIAAEQNARNIGKTLTCLVEKRLENGKLLARTEGNVRVMFDGSDDLIGQFIALLIESTGPANMSARRVEL